MKALWLILLPPALAMLGACENHMLEPAGPAGGAVAGVPERINKCIRVRFEPAKAVMSFRDELKGQLFLTSLCSDVRLPSAPTLQQDFFLTAWDDETRRRVMPMVPPRHYTMGPYGHGQYDYVPIAKGETKAFPVSEPASAFFPGPGRFTLVADYWPRSGAPVPDGVITAKDGPFNRSRVKIKITE